MTTFLPDRSQHPGTGRDLIRDVTDRIHTHRRDLPRRQIERVVHQCRSDLDIVRDEALPELLERCALQRLPEREES